MRAFKDVLNTSKIIRELNLQGNNIEDEGAAIICEALKHKPNISITFLNLSDNKITSKGAIQIADLVSKCDTF